MSDPTAYQSSGASAVRPAITRSVARKRVLVVAPDHHVYDERVLRTVDAARAAHQCFYAADREWLAELEKSDPGVRAEVSRRIGEEVELLLLPRRDRTRFVSRLTRHLYARAIGRLAARVRPDVVHIHESGTLGLLVAAWVRKLNPSCRIIFDYHDWIPYEVALTCRSRPFLYQWMLPAVLTFYRRLAQAVDVVVCISEGQAAWTRQALGVTRTVVVPNVRPRLRMTPDLAARPERPQLVFIGHVMRIRRIEFLIEVLRELRAGSLDATLLICGHIMDAAYADELLARAAALGVAEQVVFHGAYRDDAELAPLMTRGSVGLLLAHPQQIDTGILAISSANKLFSYMALGIPALLEAGFESMLRILEEHGAGCAFDSVGSCVAAVRLILETPGRWERMSRNALRLAEQMNSESYTRELETLYAS